MAGYSTPSSLAEAAYRRRAPRYALKNGIPDRRAEWRPEGDAKVLVPIVRGAWAEALGATIATIPMPAIAAALDADIERRFPAAEMVIVGRYMATATIDAAFVDVGGHEYLRVLLPDPRAVFYRKGEFPAHFTAAPRDEGHPYEVVPAAILPIFGELVALHARYQADFGCASAWAANFRFEHHRQPTWGEIEDAFPRLAAWMAAKREER